MNSIGNWKQLGTKGFAIIVLSVIIGIGSCKKEEEPCCDAYNPECANYNPCLSKEPVNAGFVITTNLLDINMEYYHNFDSDTILGEYTRVRFFANYSSEVYGDVTYKWLLGSEVINKETFQRWGFPLDTPIDITLIVSADPNNSCFPNDDGVDTLTRQFVVIGGTTDNTCLTRLKGKYLGFHIDDPEFLFDIEIKPCSAYNNWNDFIVKGIFADKDWMIMEGGGIEYNAANFYTFEDKENIYNYLRPKGYMHLFDDKNDSLRIKYSIIIGEDTDERVDKEFIGVRIP